MSKFRLEIENRLPQGLEPVVLTGPGEVRTVLKQFGWQISDAILETVEKPTTQSEIYWEGFWAQDELDDTVHLAVIGILHTPALCYLRGILVPDVPDKQRLACEAVLPDMITDYLERLLLSLAQELPPGHGKTLN